MAKHTLNSIGVELDFLLIGLMSQENMYSLASIINDTLELELELVDNIPFNLREGKLFYFSLFNYYKEEFELQFFFIPNTSNLDQVNEFEINKKQEDLFGDLNVEESTRLIKELPKTDYFLIVKGEDLHFYQFKILEKLKTKNGILQVQMIEQKELPSRMNLVF